MIEGREVVIWEPKDTRELLAALDLEGDTSLRRAAAATRPLFVAWLRQEAPESRAARDVLRLGSWGRVCRYRQAARRADPDLVADVDRLESAWLRGESVAEFRAPDLTDWAELGDGCYMRRKHV